MTDVALDPVLSAVTLYGDDRHVEGFALGVASCQPEIVALKARIEALTPKPTPIVVAPGAAALGTKRFDIPLGATVVPVKPGTVNAALKAAPAGDILLLGEEGVYFDKWDVPRGKRVTFQPRDGAVIWLDGGGTQTRQVTASSKMLFRGIGTRNHAPGWEPDPQKTDSNNTAFYFGGETPGSGFEDCWITKTTANGFTSMVPFVLRRCTVEDIGHTGFFGTTADGAVIEDVLIRRFNTKGRPAEPESAAFKVTRTRNLKTRNVVVEDGNGAHGLWLDVDCIDFSFAHVIVKGEGVSGRKAMSTGLNLELSEVGVAYDIRVTGTTGSAIVCLDTGKVRVWNADLRGNYVGLRLQNDPRTQVVAGVPRITRDTEVGNCDFDGPFPIIAYDESKGLKKVKGGDMLALLAGCTFATEGPELGDVNGARVPFNSEAALKAVPVVYGGPLGDRLGPVYFGADLSKAARAAVPEGIKSL